MNILIDNLPTEINRKQINSDFRAMVLFELMMQDEKMPNNLKVPTAISYLYTEPVDDIQEAVDGLLWFYACGEKKSGAGGGGSNKRVYDFEQDAPFIYADFLKAYGIDLNSIEYLHWWKFRALFFALPDTAKMSEIIKFRCADTARMKGDEKKYYERMKQLYRIKSTLNPEDLTLSAAEKKLKDKVKARFSAAEKWAEERQC